MGIGRQGQGGRREVGSYWLTSGGAEDERARTQNRRPLPCLSPPFPLPCLLLARLTALARVPLVVLGGGMSGVFDMPRRSRSLVEPNTPPVVFARINLG